MIWIKKFVQAPSGFADGNMKIDVGFERPCASSADNDCKLFGTPVVLAGLPGAAAAYSDEVVPGLEIRTVAVKKNNVILSITAYINGKPDRIRAYEQIFARMISTLAFDR